MTALSIPAIAIPATVVLETFTVFVMIVMIAPLDRDTRAEQDGARDADDKQPFHSSS
jgi:hypothetical protein